MKLGVEDKEANVFGMGGYKQSVGGLRMIDLAVNGYSDTTAVPDASFFTAAGVADRAFTVAPSSAAAATAFLFQAGEFSYEHFGTVGDVAPFALAAKGTNKVGAGRGQVAAAKQVVSATGPVGSPLNLGAPAGTKKVWGALHIFSIGTSISVQVQSAPLSNFAAPTVQASFGFQSATGGFFLLPTISATTDPWWRLNVFSIVGAATVSGAIAIQ